jgi:hypothetical protein
MAELEYTDQLPMQDGGDGIAHGKGKGNAPGDSGEAPKKKSRSSRDAAAIKRRCVSTACIACRRRKSKCDGNTPSCAACSSVYGTGEPSTTPLCDCENPIADARLRRMCI